MSFKINLKNKTQKRGLMPVLIPLLGFVVLCVTSVELIASEELKNKVVYLNVDLKDAELKNDPFFAGLIIEETIEKPSINFDFPFEAPPRMQIEMEPDLRSKIIILKRENTFDNIKTKSKK